jgi:hypothetical protein
MRKVFLLSMFIPALLALGETAGAQVSIRKPQLGVFGGATLPRGDFSQETDPGWNAGALFKVRVTRSIDARIDGTYSKLGSQFIEFSNAEVNSTSEVTFGTLVLELNLGPDSAEYPGDNSVSPWINVGPGMYRVKFDGTCSELQLDGCDGFLDTNEETGLGLTIGIGANVPFYRIPLFAEARYHRFGTVFPIGQVERTATMFTVSAGFKIR